eukprot:Hpha_TRINITY_DN34278_c0_g1::TRINITY_DN34278_c0_g1_i1::g.34450::m.34450
MVAAGPLPRADERTIPIRSQEHGTPNSKVGRKVKSDASSDASSSIVRRSCPASPLADTFSPGVSRAIQQRREKVVIGRSVELMLLQLPVLDKHYRHAIEIDRASEIAVMKQHESAAFDRLLDRLVTRAGSQGDRLRLWVNSCREAAIRRSAGHDALRSRRDRELEELREKGREDMSKLRCATQEEEAQLIAPQERDLMLLSEGEAWEKRDGVLEQRARLRDHFSSQLKFRGKRWDVALRSAELTWEERLGEYETAASRYAYVRVLEAEEEKCRGVGAQWREEWWGGEEGEGGIIAA